MPHGKNKQDKLNANLSRKAKGKDNHTSTRILFDWLLPQGFFKHFFYQHKEFFKLIDTTCPNVKEKKKRDK